MEKNNSLDVPTAEKVPIPQITKAWMSSFMLKNFKISVMELERYEIISPIIISVAMFFMRLLKPNIIINTNVAPMNAARLTPMLDQSPNEDNAFSPKIPVNNIVTATPRLEPLLTPSIEGSARGFLKRVCIRSPATERAAPANKAVTTWGSLYSKTIV